MKINLNDRRLLLIIPILAFIGGMLFLLPFVRQWVVEFVMQNILNRDITIDKWLRRLFRFAIISIFLSSMILLTYFLIVKIAKFKASFFNAYNELITYNYRQFFSSFVFLFVLYVVGIIGIIRADFLYVDDLGRAARGYLGWLDFSRYINNLGAILLHTGIRINDISPLNQLIAAAFMAAASVIIVHVITDKKPTKKLLLASLPIGLSPWFLQCFSYRFDSTWMALSVLASVFPFLFIRNYFLFSICSVLSLLVMSMTYQASSGIYIIIVITICFIQWNEKVKSNKEIITFAGISAITYCCTMILARIVFLEPVHSYISPDTYPASQLLSGIFNNFFTYLNIVKSDLTILWKILLLVICITFILRNIIWSKRNKIAAFCVSFLIIILLFSFSFGVYLFLSTTLFSPRGMYGVGVFIAILCILTVDHNKKIFAVPAFALCWCFFVFSFIYGNTLADQKRYISFRTEMLFHDLSILFPEKTEEPKKIKLENNAGFAPSVSSIAERKPIIKQLVPAYLDDSYWGYIYITHYYYFNLQEDKDMTDNGFDMLLDTQYHTIKSDGQKIYVILK